jgi:uncharacterized membrane protein SpoIIM required for sporulation
MKLIEKGFFKRNRKIILIAITIFLISAIAGAIVGNMQAGDYKNAISNTIMDQKNQNLNTTPLDIQMSSIELFLHNLTVDFIIILGGILFSIISVLATIFNGFGIGSPFGVDATFACASILPHGIIEYIATSLSLAAAFLITKIEIKMIKNRNIRQTIEENKVILKDILVLIIVIVILTFVAAIIEGHLTYMFINLVYGLG